jgi:hypothetical protein
MLTVLLKPDTELSCKFHYSVQGSRHTGTPPAPQAPQGGYNIYNHDRRYVPSTNQHSSVCCEGVLVYIFVCISVLILRIARPELDELDFL